MAIQTQTQREEAQRSVYRKAQLKKEIAGLRQRIHKTAAEHEHGIAKGVQVQEKLAQLERTHEEFKILDMSVLGQYAPLLILLFGCLSLDLAFVRPAVEYFLQLFGLSGFALLCGEIVFCLSLAGAEIAIASMLSFFSFPPYPEDAPGYRIYFGVSLLMGLIISLITGVITFASAKEMFLTESGYDWALCLLVIFLPALSWVLHLSLVLSWKMQAKFKTLLLFWLFRWKYQYQIESTDKRRIDCERSIFQDHQELEEKIKAYNKEYLDSSIEPRPYDRKTTEILSALTAQPQEPHFAQPAQQNGHTKEAVIGG